ncbi:MAG: tRNA-dihydrouridine synthase, partial [Clostridiales bacterium]|nr:tRNA-dihydrouridine synthase [Clostridiales bacterium]
NGDLTDVNMLPPFAAVMIGRAALKNPSVFAGKIIDPFSTARRHVELLLKYFDERYTVFQARKFFVHYFSGVRCGKQLRTAVNFAETSSEILKALDICERGQL